ncbi:MAG: serine/threonine protein kinase [Rhodopirellula sp.]|nr:serine/threonine protein kinase [Rhodopirellula sp.]
MERRRSLEMSVERSHPPIQVPGYDSERFLGVGAYGEVWVAIERNTGRRVAIKFYSHRGGLDWSLLSREVEKLAFLFADRYVVQLLGVGWDADPPYYIMEYLPLGSLAERLQDGPLPVHEAVDVFRDVAMGLLHAHGKGVLHCDLKPANILLDQDRKPRLADFGQSRLSHEQVPALGTLFYMAPEQADLSAAPDARWDVYALGAVLYSMLTGNPPHRSEEAVMQLEQARDLQRRLSIYRRMIRKSPTPTAHRQAPRVDRPLAEIIERCLAADPERRYPNIQAVLAALDARAAQRARRPMMVLGAVLPALLLAVISFFAIRGSGAIIQQSEKELTERALESNLFAAQYVARFAANELERRYEAVEQVAGSGRLHQAIHEALDDPEMKQLLVRLSDPGASEADLEPLRQRFRQHPARQTFQQQFEALIPEEIRPPVDGGGEEVASWFFVDANGVSTARLSTDPARQLSTVGKNYAWRSFFHGGQSDRPPSWRPAGDDHVRRTGPSAVFPSQANSRWIAAISTPVYDSERNDAFLGVVALTVKVGNFVDFERRNRKQFAVLVDWRDGPNKGIILQHPLFEEMENATGRVPDRFKDYRISATSLPASPSRRQFFHDPMAADPQGKPYDTRWLAEMHPVAVRGEDTGWLVIVQEAYSGAPNTIGWSMSQLRDGLVRYAAAALTVVLLIVLGLWGSVVLELLREARALRRANAGLPSTEIPGSSSTPDAPDSGSNVVAQPAVVPQNQE